MTSLPCIGPVLMISALASVLLISLAPPALAFTGGKHAEATAPAVRGRVSEDAAKVITDANKAVDKGPYHGGDHFDRNPGQTDSLAFQNGAAVFRARRDAALAAVSAGDAEAALESLGQALHTLQDLFSHSNYVEMTDADQAAVRAALDDPTLPVPAGLRLTGYDPQASGIRKFNPRGDDYEHGLVWGKHKDNAYAGEGRKRVTRGGVTKSAHAWAMEAAQRASRQLIDEIIAAVGRESWDRAFGAYTTRD